MEIKTQAQIEAESVFESTGVKINDDGHARTDMERILVQTWHGKRLVWSHGVCKVCAHPFTDEPRMVLGVNLTATVCEACGPVVTRHYGQNAQGDTLVTQTPWWDNECPTVYREFITEKRWPDTVDRTALTEVAKWGVSMRTGLLLLGPSGIGKSMALWGKARQLERTGTKPVFLSAVEFARKLACAARDIARADWLMGCSVLIVDDLGKEKLSAAVAPLLWEVIDHRNNNRLPTLISTRFEGKDFVARFADPILGEDVRGRIADCSTVIHFKKNPAYQKAA